MALDKIISKLFIPHDDVWLRHANPWSVWMRFATLPFIVLSVWSRVWIGWYCLIPVIGLSFWIWINPRLFSKPQHYNRWSARSVLGERLLMNRKESPIPAEHLKGIMILNILQTCAFMVLVYGVWYSDISATLHGVVYVCLTKMWFLDRMVWLYDTMHAN
ncbi:hypothetical protein P0Y35_01275 [Kiritimatiellaeota bacterium B1221]|nr:hypothetical protein [Kiritimatiellaeota bacterium B1221]